jgi:hypothetical protein
MKMWLIFEEVDGALVEGIMETLYSRGDSGSADLEQALDAYRRHGRSVHVLVLEVRLAHQSATVKRPTLTAEWVKQM